MERIRYCGTVELDLRSAADAIGQDESTESFKYECPWVLVACQFGRDLVEEL